MDFFCLSTYGFFFHVTAIGLRPSGVGFDGYFCLLVDLRLLFPRYCLLFKAVGFRL